jgi:spore coat protein U-like protein
VINNHPIAIWSILVLALALALAPPAQAASSTASMTVQITITASCTINAAVLDFGSNAGTALLSGSISASTTLSVTCTNGSPYSIGLNNGANASGSQRRMINGGNFISYDLYTDAGHVNAWTTATDSTTCATANSCVLGTGTGSAQTANVYGVVPAVAVAPAAGTYSDTVTMTITY